MVYVILLLGIGASSSAAILVRLCGAHPLVIAAYRMLFATMLLLPYAFLCYRDVTVGLVRSRTLPMVGSGLLLALHFATWISSLSHTSVASSAFLVTTNPIFVALGAWLLLKERLGFRLVLGTIAALAGTFWISYGDVSAGEGAIFGDALAVAGAVAMSAHLLIGRRQRQSVALTPYITVVYGVAAIALVSLAVASGQMLTGHTSRDLLLFLALALGPQLLGHTSYNYALKRLSPTILVLLMLIEPISSTFLADWILGESPSTSSMAGGLIILLGIGLALIRPTQ